MLAMVYLLVDGGVGVYCGSAWSSRCGVSSFKRPAGGAWLVGPGVLCLVVTKVQLFYLRSSV